MIGSADKASTNFKNFHYLLLTVSEPMRRNGDGRGPPYRPA